MPPYSTAALKRLPDGWRLMLMSASRLSRRQYLHAQLTEPLDTCKELIPRLGGAHTGRGARHDEVARIQRVVLREKRDLFRHAPDHLVDVRALANLAVHFEPELAFFRVPAFRRGGDRPHRGGLVEILSEGPRPAFVFSDLLQITPGHVQADGVTPDVLVRPGRGDLVAARADNRDHLGFPVVVARHRRKVHGTPLGHQIVGRLGEEERLLSAVAAHLLLVLHIVAADAEDAAHGKARVRSHDRKRGDIPTADYILHFHGEVLAKRRLFSHKWGPPNNTGDPK